MSKPADRHATKEFDCCECRRHITILVGDLPEPRLCSPCLCYPGWFKDPAMRARLGPSHDGTDPADEQVPA